MMLIFLKDDNRSKAKFIEDSQERQKNFFDLTL